MQAGTGEVSKPNRRWAIVALDSKIVRRRFEPSQQSSAYSAPRCTHAQYHLGLRATVTGATCSWPPQGGLPETRLISEGNLCLRCRRDRSRRCITAIAMAVVSKPQRLVPNENQASYLQGLVRAPYECHHCGADVTLVPPSFRSNCNTPN